MLPKSSKSSAAGALARYHGDEDMIQYQAKKKVLSTGKKVAGADHCIMQHFPVRKEFFQTEGRNYL